MLLRNIFYVSVKGKNHIRTSFIKKPYTVFQKHSSSTYNYSDFGKCYTVKIGNVSPERPIPADIITPEYYHHDVKPGNTLGEGEIKSFSQICKMRQSCKLAAEILKSCGDIIKIGVTTDEIDRFAHEKIISAKAYPSPLRYGGFPKSICTSVNNVACHGIPDDRPLQDGDIINVDITIYLNGYHGDCSKTFIVGDVDECGLYLVNKAEECLSGCIHLCKPDVTFNSIGNHVHNFSKKFKLNTFPAFTGHGIGSYFHGPPEILHFENHLPGKMVAGMTFTIEPILTLGGHEIEILEDGWTAVSVDGARSAQFEHTILITETSHEILTVSD